MIELPEQRSGFEIRALCFGIHAHTLHGLQVDYEPALARRFAGQAVPARAHRRQQPVFPSEVDGAPHVGGAGAAGDQSRMPIEHRIPDSASGIVRRMVLTQDLASHARSEGLDVGSAQYEIAAVQGLCREVGGTPGGCPAAQRQVSGERGARRNELTSLHDRALSIA